MKLILIVSVTIFGLIGAYVPYIWGDTNFFGTASILTSAVGGIVGIFIGWWVAKRIDI